MKWILMFLCLPAFGQLPVLPFAPRSSSQWFPTNVANTMFYWFELTPVASQRLNTDGSGGVPLNAQRAGSWINLAHNNDVAGANINQCPTNFVSGGGNNGTSPRIAFHNVISCQYTAPSVGLSLTNFTTIIVMNASNSATASQEVFGNGNFAPYLDINANKITINAGSDVSGATTIANLKYYIITWKQNGASSEIDTNGVLYASGNSGTIGFTSIQGPLMGHDRVNQFTGNICRVWCWTNQLSAGDLSTAITQCKTDFGFP